MKKTLIAVLIVGVAAVATHAADPVSRRDAARLQGKIDRINKLGGLRGRVATRTPISEAELNSYLQYELGDRVPTGVKDPWVSILGDGRVSGRATVDLGQVGQSRKSGGMLDPFSYLTGSLPLVVNGVLRTKGGVGSFALESASLSGVPVPAWMLQEIVGYYSKSPTDPNGVSLDKPFALPSGIQEIEIDKGLAVVVQ
jgi:hypothetical protein